MVRLFLVALACSVLLCAQQSSLETARELLEKGQTNKAISILKEIVRTDPKNATAQILLGSALANTGNREESLAHLNEAVRLEPNSAAAQNVLGEALDTFKELQPAYDAFQSAVRLDPKNGHAQENLGIVLLEMGKFDEAATQLDRALPLLNKTPEEGYALYLRAKIYSEKSETQKAAAALTRAVQLRPGLAEAWSDLGLARKTLLDDRGALAAYKRAVELKPEDSVAQYRLGAEYLAQNQPHLAVEHLRQAYRINPQDQSTLNSLQMALRRDGKTQEANGIRRQLAELLRKKDQDTQNAIKAIKINNEGSALEKSGDLRSASEKYREALNIDPDHVGIRVNLAIALLKLGQWSEGLSQLKEAMRRDPGNDQLKAAWKDAVSQAPAGTLVDGQPLAQAQAR